MNNKKSFKIITYIADLHIGVKRISAEVIKSQLKKYYIKPLENMAYLDAIVVLGDVLHTILSLNSEYSEVFNWFISKLYKIAKKRKCSVIILKGTISHDNDQLNNIKYYENNDDGVDFRIYETVESITLFNDYKVLVLPDVKVSRLGDIDKYLDKKYDLIFGHGLIDKMQFFVQESEQIPMKTYVYDVKKLMEASRGPIVFGHIHEYTNINNKFYYSGPFTTIERGSNQKTGFLICAIYDNDRTQFVMNRYINEDAANYFDIKITKDILSKYSIDDIMFTIDTIIADARDSDLISLRITHDDTSELLDKVILLESNYSKDNRFSITKKTKTKNEEESEKINSDKKAKYAYIMDPNLSMGEIMYRYFNEDIKPANDQYSQLTNITIDDFINVLENK